MNGYPVLVFFDGEFQFVVLCSTTDIAKAVIFGLEVGEQVTSDYWEHADHVIVAFMLWPGGRHPQVDSRTFLEQIKGAVGDDRTIRLGDIEKALEALGRAESKPFPVVPTIVK